MLLTAWVDIVNQSTHFKCHYDNFWPFHLFLLALLYYIRFSDDWIFKHLKDVYEFQTDYANWEYSISSLVRRPGVLRQLYTYGPLSVCLWERVRERGSEKVRAGKGK